MIALVQTWVDQNPGKECKGSERSALVAKMRPYLPAHLTDQKLSAMVSNTLSKLRPVFKPEHTPKNYHKREIGDPGGLSSSELNPKQAAFRAASIAKRHEAARDRLKEKGHGDATLDPVEVSLEFLGRRGAHIPVRVDGVQPRNRHVLARGAASTSERNHFTDDEAKKELGMKYLVVYESNVRLNAFAVEDALQTALQRIPLGRRLWRWVAMGQKEPATLPNEVNLYKVFITYSFEVQAAIEAKKGIVVP